MYAQAAIARHARDAQRVEPTNRGSLGPTTPAALVTLAATAAVDLIRWPIMLAADGATYLQQRLRRDCDDTARRT
jgi:hypothetical protein